MKASTVKRLLLADLLLVLLVEVNLFRRQINESEVSGYEAGYQEEHQPEPESLSLVLLFSFAFQRFPRLGLNSLAMKTLIDTNRSPRQKNQPEICPQNTKMGECTGAWFGCAAERVCAKSDNIWFIDVESLEPHQRSAFPFPFDPFPLGPLSRNVYHAPLTCTACGSEGGHLLSGRAQRLVQKESSSVRSWLDTILPAMIPPMVPQPDNVKASKSKQTAATLTGYPVQSIDPSRFSISSEVCT